MQIFHISRNYKNFARIARVVTILGKYGFGAFLTRMREGLREIPERRFNVRLERNLQKLTEPERLRLAIEELGPTFIKMGQILSLRPDIIPPEYASELEKLQDRNPPSPYEKIQQILEQEYGASLDSIFSKFDEVPVASGSLAQVHRAVLKEGERTVAVKILKPKMREIVDTDLNVIQIFLNIASHYIPEFNQYDVNGLFQEFSETLLNEMNFQREAHNMIRFKKFFKGEDYVHIPEVYLDYTTNSIIVMEFIEGIKISEVEEIKNAGIDPKIVAENGARIVLKEIFEFGFFHADPHYGNLFVLPNNIVAPVDFGITGYIDAEGSEVLGNFFVGILKKDVDSIVHHLKRYDFIPENVDERKLKLDFLDLIETAYKSSLEEISIYTTFQQLFVITRNHKLRFPHEYFLIFKTLLQADGVGRRLYPDFNVIKFAEPFVKSWFMKQFRLKSYVKDFMLIMDDLRYLLKSIPSEFGPFFKRLLTGRLRVPLYHENLDRAIYEIDRTGNRLSFSIIIAALLLASSMLVQAKVGPLIKGYPVIGLVGFFTAAIMGLWLLIGIIKSGRL
ncbi:MAG: hypothetical protein DRP84_12090 [Spirochaetes bacterium]|nr:MAG: hypothetical protein DRP84_12090 [Spirochaetota bacterium]